MKMAIDIFCRSMMTLLRRDCARLKICKRKMYNCDSNIFLTQRLAERTLLKLTGSNANEYMQGLITNDMQHLKGGAPSIFALFLNDKGRVLYDTIIYNTSHQTTYFIECDSAAAQPLIDHLNHFKVRRKIDVDNLKDEYNIWVLSKNNPKQNSEDLTDYKNVANIIKESQPEIMSMLDPRLSTMGLRLIAKKNVNVPGILKESLTSKTKEENFYKLLRYRLGIAEGMEELPTGKCFPMEINGDYMHGISFHKGCYIGQELTARTYHTGAIRKRIMPIELNEVMETSEHSIPIYDPLNKSVGKLFGIEKTNGIAMLRIEEALNAEEMIISNKRCTTSRPFWWPIEAPKRRVKTG